MLWRDPTGVVKPVEIPMFASLCEELSERTCPSQNDRYAQVLPSCAAYSAVMALMLLSQTQARSRAPDQDEWLYKENYWLKSDINPLNPCNS